MDPVTTLLADSRGYWAPSAITETAVAPSALSFLREHVSQSVPLVLRGLAASWPAVSRWTPAYLRAAHGGTQLSVALTPDGYADAVTQSRFAQPLVVTWSLARLLDALQPGATATTTTATTTTATTTTATTTTTTTTTATTITEDDDCVPYYSAQNSCLTDEAPALCADIDVSTIDFAREALGQRETAANLWIGDGRSVTTAHADPFENLYAVVRGRKRFALRPPSDAAVLRKPLWRDARWARRDGQWVLQDENGFTRWIDHREKHPGEPLFVDLHPGDVLYLPALWFHGVTQFGLTIAVNWWFDMTYGRDWVMKQLFDNLRDAADNKTLQQIQDAR